MIKSFRASRVLNPGLVHGKGHLLIGLHLHHLSLGHCRLPSYGDCDKSRALSHYFADVIDLWLLCCVTGKWERKEGRRQAGQVGQQPRPPKRSIPIQRLQHRSVGPRLSSYKAHRRFSPSPQTKPECQKWRVRSFAQYRIVTVFIASRFRSYVHHLMVV
jgi:hypothetical protein